MSDVLVTHTAPDEGPVWRRIAEALAAEIGAGLYAPGDSLPTAVQLSERHGVHRHTIRQAFRHLAERGLVSVEQGRGTFVTQQRLPYPIGRNVSFRANLAAVGRLTTGRVLESATIPAPAAIAQRLRLESGAAIWQIRTLSEADGVPMSTSLHYLDTVRFPDFPARLAASNGSVTRAMALSGIDHYERRSTRLHARAATALEARLLQLAEGAPVLHSSGLDARADGTPVQIAESAFAGDRMEFVVEPG